MRAALLSGAVASAIAPVTAFAVDYMTAEQAAKLMFPDADAFEARTVVLDAATLQQLEAQGLRGRSPSVGVRIARRGGSSLGYVVTDEVVGKVELIGYAVAVGTDGAVKQIEILSYRESHGFEIRLLGWRKQFVGKGPGAPIKVGDDIANISGATLSCTHVTDGVRRIVAVVAGLRRSGALP